MSKATVRNKIKAMRTKPELKNNHTVKDLVDRYGNNNAIERCYLLVQALGAVDIQKVATSFDINDHEASKLIKEVIIQYDYMLSDIAITCK